MQFFIYSSFNNTSNRYIWSYFVDFHISLSIHWFCTTYHISIKPVTSKSKASFKTFRQTRSLLYTAL